MILLSIIEGYIKPLWIYGHEYKSNPPPPKKMYVFYIFNTKLNVGVLPPMPTTFVGRNLQRRLAKFILKWSLL